MTLITTSGKTPLSQTLIYLIFVLYFMFRKNNLRGDRFLLTAFRFDNILSMAASSLLLQMLRTVEVIVGSNRYSSVTLKYCLHHFGFCSSGFFFLTASLTAYYWKVVPTSVADSFSIVVCMLLLLLSSAFSPSALFEVIVSFCIGLFITPSLSHPRPFIPFPKGMTSFLSELYEEPTTVNIRNGYRGSYQPAMPRGAPSRTNQDDFEEVEPDEELVQQLMGMGFEREDCVRELKKSMNDVNVAANRLLNAM